jgi:hypothetical protein
MSAAVTDIATIRAARRAAAAEAERKRDPLNNPLAVLIVQLVLHRLILMDQVMREFFTSDRSS